MTLKFFTGCAAVAVMFAAIATPAFADFHYIPGPSSPTAPAAPAASQEPAASPSGLQYTAPVEAAPLSTPATPARSSTLPRSGANAPSMAPMTDSTDNLNASAVGGSPTSITAPSSVIPSRVTSLPPVLATASAAAPVPMRASHLSGGAVVQGFGNKIPLVIALRQIVPESYQFAYGPNVPLGGMVDWNGGRPWKDVLSDTLAPLGLSASESGSVIKIDRS